jgi:hypothetical protein
LLGEEVIDARLPVGEVIFQAHHQPFGDLTQENARLGGGVEKSGGLVAPDVAGQQIEHLVDEVGRGENLVAAQIGQAGQHIGIVVFNHNLQQPLENEPVEILQPTSG